VADKTVFRFSVDSALLGELGEKLVSTVHVALSELVKNSYDADATEVQVSILKENGRAPRVTVEDNGHGMNLEEVRRFWMIIGTSNKLATPQSRLYGRPKAGSKGVGRFASRRLGLNLKLTTCAAIEIPEGGMQYQTTEIEFNWLQFQAGVDVESVECTGETSLLASGKTGTRLEIWGGKADEWQIRGFEYLQRQLAVLATNRGTARKGYQEDPGFNVVLDAPGISGKPIDVRESVIDGSWGTLAAEVLEDGRAQCTLNAKGLGGSKRFMSKERFRSVVGARLRVGILPTQKEEARKPELLATYVLSELVDKWGGIHVRLNGFRVYPYGDPGDDWLRIDADRGRRVGKPEGELFDFAKTLHRIDATRSLLNMLGMRNYIGQVEASSQTTTLTPRIDRQGFVANDAFDELRRFARFAIDWANIHRENFIRLREGDQAEQAREAIRPILDLEGPTDEIVPKAAAFLRSEFKRVIQHVPAKIRKDTEKTLLQTLRAIETTNAESQKQLQHLRLIASASTLTLLFAHEVRTMIGTLGGMAARLTQLSGQVPNSAVELKAAASELRETKQRFDALIAMTGVLSGTGEAQTLLELHLKSAVERAGSCFRLVTETYGIGLDDSAIDPSLTVGPMLEGELYTVLLNILSNAIKATVASRDEDRSVRFEATQNGKRVRIRLLDNGIGLSPAFYEDVFTPFIADPSGDLYDRLQERAKPEDLAVFGTGSGLGLAIARDVARSRGGDIRFMNAPSPWKTCVEVDLP